MNAEPVRHGVVIPVSQELLGDTPAFDLAGWIRRAEEDRRAFEALPPEDQARILAARDREAAAAAERERRERLAAAGVTLRQMLPVAAAAVSAGDKASRRGGAEELHGELGCLDPEDLQALALLALLGLAQAGIAGVDLPSIKESR